MRLPERIAKTCQLLPFMMILGCSSSEAILPSHPTPLPSQEQMMLPMASPDAGSSKIQSIKIDPSKDIGQQP